MLLNIFIQFLFRCPIEPLTSLQDFRCRIVKELEVIGII